MLRRLLRGSARALAVTTTCSTLPFLSTHAPAPAFDLSAAGRPSAPAPAVEPLPDMIARVLPAVCKVEGVLRGVRVSSGSGFVVSSDGLVVTNHHVIAGAVAAGCHELRVSFDDGRVFRMTPLSADAEADIAVGRLAAPAGTEFPALKLGDAGAMRAGDALVVLGAPLGGSLAPSVGALCGSRYVGDDEALSAVLPSRPDWHLLQVDAAMSSGGSGGPVVNARGEVVGISVMVRTGSVFEVGSISYAVSAEQAAPVIASLLASGRVARPAVGLTLLPVDRLTDEAERAAGGAPQLPRAPPSPGAPPFATGALVTGVAPGLPAAAAGLRPGDVILAVNGTRVVRLADYFRAVGPVFDADVRLRCTVFRPPAAPGDDGRVFEAIVAPTERADPAGRARRGGGFGFGRRGGVSSLAGGAQES